MAITIGRIGTATSVGGDGLTLNEPFEWSVEGDQVTMQGLFKATSDAQAVHFQRQITGLDPARNVDEQSVPFTSSLAPDLNGYYTVTDAGATITRGALGSGTGIVVWHVTAIRARDHISPNVEMTHSHALMTNTEGVTTAISYLAVPAAATVARADFTTVAGTTRTTEYGDVVQFNAATSGTAAYAPVVYTVVPESYYQGAPRITTSSGVVVGRGGLPDPSVSNVVISNGIVRATITGGLSFTLGFWDDSTAAWESATSMESYITAGATRMYHYGATVLKNAADECTLRVRCRVIVPTYNLQVFTIDFTLRRGDAYFRVVITPRTANGTYLRPVTATAFTAVSPWGMRSTSTDADGQYLLMAGADVGLTTASPGVVSNNGGGAATFMCGFSETTGSAGNYDVDNVLNGFFRTHGTAQRVVVG